jgi:hypothetical protein
VRSLGSPTHEAVFTLLQFCDQFLGERLGSIAGCIGGFVFGLLCREHFQELFCHLYGFTEEDSGTLVATGLRLQGGNLCFKLGDALQLFLTLSLGSGNCGESGTFPTFCGITLTLLSLGAHASLLRLTIALRLQAGLLGGFCLATALRFGGALPFLLLCHARGFLIKRGLFGGGCGHFSLPGTLGRARTEYQYEHGPKQDVLQGLTAEILADCSFESATHHRLLSGSMPALGSSEVESYPQAID